MGLVHVTLELRNRWQLKNEKHELVDDYDVQQMQVNMLADTGSYYLCINENVAKCLGLNVLYKRPLELADGTIAEYDVAGPIEVQFEDRAFISDAVVLPGNSECLLGEIPMENLDVIICPKRQELIVNPEPYQRPMWRF